MKRRVCVAIETAGTHLGLGLYESGKGGVERLALSFEPESGRQSDRIVPLLQSLLKKARLSKEDMSLVAVDHGPGSFTGVRVGVSVARALAQGLDLPIVGVCGLEAIAREDHFGAGARIAACLPALAGDVYYAVYTAGPWYPPVVAPSWGREEQFIETLKNLQSDGRETIVTGAVPAALAGRLGPLRHVRVSARNRPAHPDWIAAAAFQSHDLSAPKARYRFDTVAPLYLQPSWAERTKKAE